MFYAWGEPTFIFIMLFSILMNYFIGRMIDKKHSKKFYLNIGLVGNLLLLIYFKYFSFLAVTIAELFSFKLSIPDVVLPIGISFFTFQAISYLVDLYKKEIKVQKNPLNLALYISFFPQLIAGPIVRYHDIEKQITERKVLQSDFLIGIRRFIIGFSKKILIANTFAKIADEIFALPETEFTTHLILFAMVSYTIQIYFDFSGYSDMAIGLGRMFGFKFLENFNYPYVSRSIKEFWQRWHISLSTFLKDYLYIPLGGSRVSKLATYRNLVIVFLLCGLWHGAGWTFIIWGLYFGVFLILERLFLGEILKKLPKFISWFYSITVVMFGWLIFRAENLGQFLSMLEALFAGAKNPVYKKYAKDTFIILMLFIAFIGATPLFQKKIWQSKRIGVQFLMDIFLIACFVISVSFLASGTYNPFIYFRF